MLNTITIDSINSFLKICRKEIQKGHCYFVGYRKLNINGKIISAKQALVDIGITKIDQIWDYVLTLEAKDCIKIDRDRDSFRDLNAEIYIFKKEINFKMVYIKLTMNNRGIICISFHESY